MYILKVMVIRKPILNTPSIETSHNVDTDFDILLTPDMSYIFGNIHFWIQAVIHIL